MRVWIFGFKRSFAGYWKHSYNFVVLIIMWKDLFPQYCGSEQSMVFWEKNKWEEKSRLKVFHNKRRRKKIKNIFKLSSSNYLITPLREQKFFTPKCCAPLLWHDRFAIIFKNFQRLGLQWDWNKQFCSEKLLKVITLWKYLSPNTGESWKIGNA